MITKEDYELRIKYKSKMYVSLLKAYLQSNKYGNIHISRMFHQKDKTDRDIIEEYFLYSDIDYRLRPIAVKYNGY